MYRSETAPQEGEYIARPYSSVTTARIHDDHIHAASIASAARTVVLYADNEAIEVFSDYDEARNASAKYEQFKSGLLTMDEWRAQHFGELSVVFRAEDINTKDKN